MLIIISKPLYVNYKQLLNEKVVNYFRWPLYGSYCFLFAKTVTQDERMQWWRDARFGMFVHWDCIAYLQVSGTEKKYPV